jgi:dihydropyrimidinase
LIICILIEGAASVMLDLVVRGGTVVTAGSSGAADVGVLDGRVVQLGGPMHGRREIDASGKLVLPGGVDVHVHLSAPAPAGPDDELWVDDFYSGSLAAIAGGITTVGNMTFQWPGESLADALGRDRASAERDVAVDVLLHPVLTDPSTASLAELPGLAAQGYASLKVFMVTPEFDANVEAYIEAIRTAGSLGMMTMIHCEDGAIIRCICRELAALGRTAVQHWAESRPVYTESAATERAIAISRATDAPIYVVHLSSRAALEACRRARADGIQVSVETRPLYLHLTSELLEGERGGMYVGAPPLRARDDLEAIWNGLRDATIQCVCTDHAPWSMRQKLDPSLDVTTARQGVADLDTSLPMLHSEGVRTGKISIERFVEVVATNPARLFGLYPRKGTIAVGSDADLVVWDPELVRTVAAADLRSRSDYSVYEGREVQGWPVVTVSRGDVVLEGGEISAEKGRGRLLVKERA